jgi:hypothetical protein
VLSDCFGRYPSDFVTLSRKFPRKLYFQSGVSYGSVNQATKILKVSPHHVQVMHYLKEPDKGKEFSTADGLHTSFEGV